MELVGQKVYFVERKIKKTFIGEIVNVNDNKMTVKILMVNGKPSRTNEERECYLYDLDKKIQRICFKDLVTGQHFSNRAFDVYAQCVYVCGFDASKMDAYELRTNLYSEGATKEGYDVWFMCNSNLYTSGGSTRWKNTVSEDWSEVKEEWIKKSVPMSDSGNDRLIFIKNKFGVYEFAGVYKTEVWDMIGRFKIYKRISKNYPIKK